MSYVLKKKVILLNAPPNTGKDLAASVLKELTGATHREFKEPLHRIAMAVTGLSPEDYYEIYNDRELKEVPHKLFLGLSPRGMMIWISEDVCKPKFGKNHFGNEAAKSLNLETGTVFSDSGFPDELIPVAEAAGPENVYVIRFTRNGADYGDDSRGYLKEEDCPQGVHFIDLENDGDIYDFINKILEEVSNV